MIVLCIHAGLLAYSATQHSPTMDEPAHLMAGLSHWKFERFDLYCVNPPLVKMIAALPVIAVGYKEDWSGFYEGPGVRSEFSMGRNFVETNQDRSLWLFTIARWACIPISLAGGAFCFLWSRELWGSSLAGVASLTVWCFEPNILAHGELITPDCAATSFGLGAGYLFWRWLSFASWERALAAGFLLGLAELSKMTWIILFGLWPLLWLFWLASDRRQPCDNVVRNARSSILNQFGQMTLIVVLGLFVLNAGYGFDGTLKPLKGFTFVSSGFTAEKRPGIPGNRFVDTPLENLPVPFPEQYLIGMDLQKYDFEDYAHPSYLRGEWKQGGWWYYYIYGLAVKTPHGTQFLLGLAIVTLICQRYRQSQDRVWRDLVILMVPAACVLAMVSSQLAFNHHVRYVLPVLGFTFVLIGGVARGLSMSPAAVSFTNYRCFTKSQSLADGSVTI